jgi:hypothetical protein
MRTYNDIEKIFTPYISQNSFEIFTTTNFQIIVVIKKNRLRT